MPTRGPCLMLMAIVLAMAACADGAVDTTTTMMPANAGSITFALGIDDSGKRLLVRPGDQVIVRLPITGTNEPDWQVVTPPDPSVLGGGDNLRFYPSEPEQGRPFHEFTFVAVGPGEATIALFQSPITEEAPPLTFTIEVVAP